MVDGGRARTYNQRNSVDVDQAVASCPVSCMYPVSYRELKEYETARDEGDGRTDHKHLGHQRGMTPLHVAGMDSDNNHRTSWYHTLKSKCLGKFPRWILLQVNSYDRRNLTVFETCLTTNYKYRESVHKKVATTVQSTASLAQTPISRSNTKRRNTFEHSISWTMATSTFGEKQPTCKGC
jgi:hypothetical protein